MNPLQFLLSPKTPQQEAERRLFFGGVLNSLIYYGNLYAENTLADYPQMLKDKLDVHLPTNGEIITDVAPPVAFYIGEKVSKSAGTKEKMSDYALGASLFAFPNLMARVGVDTAYVEGMKQRLGAALHGAVTASKYIVQTSTPATRTTAGLSKYVVTS
jgi:hypothetical protein